MEELRRWLPITVVILLTLGLHVYVARKLGGRRAWVVAALASLWMGLAPPLLMRREHGLLSANQISYLMAATLGWVLVALSGATWMWLRRAPEEGFDPSRRRFLARAAPLLASAPLTAAGGGAVVARTGLHTREVDVRIAGLPKDLDGLRLAQLTDIHYGPFFGRAELERAVAMANECRPHLTLVTGDLITRVGDNLEECLGLLRGLKAEAGVYGCHGNHEEYADVLELATELGARQGLRFLRGEAAALRFGEATLNLAGHDFQEQGVEPFPEAGRLVRAGALNVLMQHNPAAFRRAAEFGFDLMLAGHTHGGQINLGVLGTNLNVARIFTPYVRGEYSIGGKLLYVSSGLGTVAIPVRLGAPPEVTVIRLCAG